MHHRSQYWIVNSGLKLIDCHERPERIFADSSRTIMRVGTSNHNFFGLETQIGYSVRDLSMKIVRHCHEIQAHEKQPLIATLEQHNLGSNRVENTFGWFKVSRVFMKQTAQGDKSSPHGCAMACQRHTHRWCNSLACNRGI